MQKSVVSFAYPFTSTSEVSETPEGGNLELDILGVGSFLFLAARGTFNHAIKHYDRRDALNDYHQGAETEEEQNQGAAYEDFVGCSRRGQGTGAACETEDNSAAYCRQS